jgi:hypothetical protein
MLLFDHVCRFLEQFPRPGRDYSFGLGNPLSNFVSVRFEQRCLVKLLPILIQTLRAQYGADSASFKERGRPRLGVDNFCLRKEPSPRRGGTAESCVRDTTRLLHGRHTASRVARPRFPCHFHHFCTIVTGSPQMTAKNLCSFASSSSVGLLTFDSALVVTEQYANQRS